VCTESQTQLDDRGSSRAGMRVCGCVCVRVYVTVFVCEFVFLCVCSRLCMYQCVRLCRSAQVVVCVRARLHLVAHVTLSLSFSFPSFFSILPFSQIRFSQAVMTEGFFFELDHGKIDRQARRQTDRRTETRLHVYDSNCLCDTECLCVCVRMCACVRICACVCMYMQVCV